METFRRPILALVGLFFFAVALSLPLAVFAADGPLLIPVIDTADDDYDDPPAEDEPDAGEPAEPAEPEEPAEPQDPDQPEDDPDDYDYDDDY